MQEASQWLIFNLSPQLHAATCALLEATCSFKHSYSQYNSLLINSGCFETTKKSVGQHSLPLCNFKAALKGN